MSRFDSVLSWIENFLATAALAAAFLISVVAVILRYAFDSGIFWAQEATIYLIILSTFVGAVITLRHDEHVNVDILPTLLGERGKWVFALIGSGLTLVYCGAIGALSWVLITEPAALSTTTPAMGIPLWVVEIGLVVGLTLMFVRSLELVYRTARRRQTFPEAERDEMLGYAEEAAAEMAASERAAEAERRAEQSDEQSEERRDDREDNR